MAKASEDGRGRTVRSVGIAFEILDVLQERGKSNVTELDEALEYSRSTIHSHLRTLEEQRMVARDGYDYRLSLRILDMSRGVRDLVGNYDVIRNEVDALAEKSGETAQFGIEEHGQVSYLYKTTGENGIKSASKVGTKQPIHSTALGKSILAFLPDDRVEEILHSCEYERRAPNTISGPDELLEEVERTRERGYGIDDEENVEGIRCVAAPVKSDDQVLGAVSLTGPSIRFTTDRIHGELSDLVQYTANIIEINTKFS
ncbi:IclR family transcriptional regulator [Halosimplex aquaticum]|uniref:IclR family transcriptional regulator n=1 Tax=Halosimplex aquaticum TaxID=3026162 RepID=A0ABD5XYW8_9EURY|nr:IclR family transcriptional regulator [Halosimplex aquaticum]